MSFSSDVKRELCRLLPERRCCLTAELTALLRCGGSLVVIAGNDYPVLRLSTTVSAVAGKAFAMARKLFGVHGTITLKKTRKPGIRTDYLLEWDLSETTWNKMLKPLGFLSGGHFNPGIIPQRLISRQCCRRSAYRGFFLGGGYIEDPHQNYHLGLRFTYMSVAEWLEKLLREEGLAAHLRDRDGEVEIYIKGGDYIGTFLAMIEAVRSLLLFEEIRVEKSLRNRVNRLVNCDTANLDRTVSSALKQICDIRYLECTGGLDSLPEPLQEVARLRLAHPLASLSQLVDLIDVSVSRSCINHRLRKLQKLAKARLDAVGEQTDVMSLDFPSSDSNNYSS